MDDKIIIELSKSKILFYSVVSIILPLFGMFFARGLTHDDSFIVFLGWVMILLGGTLSYLIIRKLFDNRPGVVITSESFTNNSTMGPYQTILWSDVKEIKERGNGSNRSIFIFTFNPDDYAEHSNLIIRTLNRFRVNLVGTSVVVNASSLKISHTKLLYALISNSKV